MALGKWHRGKLVILWSWGIVAMVLLYVGLSLAYPPTNVGGAIWVLSFVILILAIPLALSVITWRWLTARESTD